MSIVIMPSCHPKGSVTSTITTGDLIARQCSSIAQQGGPTNNKGCSITGQVALPAQKVALHKQLYELHDLLYLDNNSQICFILL